jgi:3-phenylpropionate/trans-cinnamate dioxygenase ferredoxin component
MSELRVPRAALAPGEARRLGAGSTAVCLVRINDDFYAVGDRCSHADVSLSEGDVDVEDRWIECWKHGSAFSLVDGEPQSLPATKPVPVYPVVIDGEDVVVTIP